MDKHKFKSEEQYAVWLHNQKRCWFCFEPQRLFETTIDHVIPENLLKEPAKLQELIRDFGLPDGFDINGFENWLPCHDHCNKRKGSSPFVFSPHYKVLLDRLIKNAPK